MTTGAEVEEVGQVRGAAHDLVARIEAENFRPLWLRPEQPTEPLATLRPFLWNFAAGRQLLIEAGDELDLGGEGGVDRRVLTMANPSHPILSTTQTLTGALQLVRPGEQAPSHRHTPAALRFIIEGEGASTVVEGTEVPMEPGDLVLTPSWFWHGHTHAGGSAMIWLDVLDVPLVRSLDLAFHEEFSAPKSLQAVAFSAKAVRCSATLVDLLPSATYAPHPDQPPILRYGFATALEALSHLRSSDATSHTLRFVDPRSGGPVMTTIDAELILIEAGGETASQRDTVNRLYHVARGSGHSVIDGERLDWGFGDTFCVPTWCDEAHFAAGGEEAVLFVASDEPVQRALGLYRSAQPSA